MLASVDMTCSCDVTENGCLLKKIANNAQFIPFIWVYESPKVHVIIFICITIQQLAALQSSTIFCCNIIFETLCSQHCLVCYKIHLRVLLTNMTMEQAKCKNIYIEKHDYDDENIRLITLLSYIVNCFTILI